MSTPGDDEQQELVASLRSVRDEARQAPEPRPVLPEYRDDAAKPSPLPGLDPEDADPLRSSPDRTELNTLWNVTDSFTDTPRGFFAKLLSPLRGLLRRIVHYALGPVVERQVQMNSAQVRFDNEVIAYLDARLDRIERHYDRVLGLHGKRMEEIDERHLILQQELIRHVHDLVERIEFVFETAETNHLQIEGVLRETREELRQLAARLDAHSATGDDER